MVSDVQGASLARKRAGIPTARALGGVSEVFLGHKGDGFRPSQGVFVFKLTTAALQLELFCMADKKYSHRKHFSKGFGLRSIVSGTRGMATVLFSQPALLRF